VLLYSDDLIERRTEDIDTGLGRLASHVERWPAGRSLAQLCQQALHQLAQQFHNGKHQVLPTSLYDHQAAELHDDASARLLEHLADPAA
jgi:hypothetical protein